MRMRQMRKSLLANGAMDVGGDVTSHLSSTAPHQSSHQIDKSKVTQSSLFSVLLTPI